MTKSLNKATTAQPAAGRKIGYGRVSTEHQSEAQQRAQLEAAGCTSIYTEQISSGKKDRPQLQAALAELQANDTLVICKLDRLARSLQELLNTAADLDARGINLQVLDQQIDTSTPTGRLLFQILGSVAEFERSLAIERTRASVEHRRATGGNLGGRKLSYTPEQVQWGRQMRAEGKSLNQIAAALKLSKGTTHRMLSRIEQGTAS